MNDRVRLVSLEESNEEWIKQGLREHFTLAFGREPRPKELDRLYKEYQKGESNE